MAPVVSWVWGVEEKEAGVGEWQAPMRGMGEVGGVWEGFGDEVENE